MRAFSPIVGSRSLGILGAVCVGIPALLALLAPVCSSFDPAAPDVSSILLPPSSAHLLGTDELGRDLLARMLYGARISLSVGFLSVGLMMVIGVSVGAIAGYYGGLADSLIMRCVDVMLCIPTFFLILAVVAFISPSIWAIMCIIGCTRWMDVARLTRAEFLSLKTREYVLAARAQGLPHRAVILRHILPNALSPILVAAVLNIAGAIMTESALSFLGLGVQPPTPSWGNILAAGKDVLISAWWLSLFPGLSILITVLGFNLCGDSLRESIYSK